MLPDAAFVRVQPLPSADAAAQRLFDSLTREQRHAVLDALVFGQPLATSHYFETPPPAGTWRAFCELLASWEDGT